MDISSAVAALLGVTVSFLLEEIRFHFRRKVDRQPSVTIDRRRDQSSGENFVIVTNSGDRAVTIVGLGFDDGSGFSDFSSFSLQPNACREFAMRDALGSGRVHAVVSGGRMFFEK